jgi:FkbM family methyltransferase
MTSIRKIISQYINPSHFYIYRKYFVKKFSPSDKNLFNYLKYYSYKKDCDITFLQIGGNDGIKGDPIHHFVERHHWKGYVLEPQKEVFENELKETYRNNDHINLINAAISDHSGSQQLYKISFSQNRWATGLASFKKENIIKNIDNGYIAMRAKEEGVTMPENIEDCIAVENVITLSFQDLISELESPNLDLIAIDTEGYDYNILKMIDFNLTTPDLILYENVSFSIEQKNEINSILSTNNYKVIDFDMNSIALKKHLAPTD